MLRSIVIGDPLLLLHFRWFGCFLNSWGMILFRDCVRVIYSGLLYFVIFYTYSFFNKVNVYIYKKSKVM